MSNCIETTPYTLDIEALEEGSNVDYYVKITSTTPTIRIIFAPPAGGSIEGVSVTGARHGANWIEFTSANLDTIYTVGVQYTPPAPESEDSPVPTISVPTKSPKFKPQTTCPAW